MKQLVHFSRLFVGLLFIFSGSIKLNDPVGFSFKLDEYFSPAVFDIPFLRTLALTIAILMVMYEIILGVFLLLGYKPKFTLYSLLGLTIFFAFLTFYSAYFNKVTDCGCFGDAIKLTPWQSFWKDIVFLAFILIIYFNQKYIRPLFHNKINFKVSCIIGFILIIICYKTVNYLPFIDFRPYTVTTNILEKMKTPEGAPVDEFEIKWIYEINGTKKEFSNEDEPWNIANANFVDRKTKLIKKGYTPPIHDFTMEKDGEDFTTQFLNEDFLLITIAYNLSKSNEKGFEDLSKISNFIKSKNLKSIGLSASVNTTNITKKMNIDFYFCDETTLKTIVRSNPGLLLLKKGIIVGKWSYKNLPTVSDLKSILK